MYPGKHTLCPGCSEAVINLLTFYAAESLRNNPEGIATFYQGIKILSEKVRYAIEHMLDHGFNIYTINATGCNQVSELGNPFNTRIYQTGHYGFGTASARPWGPSSAWTRPMKTATTTSSPRSSSSPATAPSMTSATAPSTTPWERTSTSPGSFTTTKAT
jgi:hypothetical protein